MSFSLLLMMCAQRHVCKLRLALFGQLFAPISYWHVKMYNESKQKKNNITSSTLDGRCDVEGLGQIPFVTSKKK